jgi:micrococcal nuclease
VIQISRTAQVSHVIDGDTIILDTGEKVRLIGIDTPEVGQPCYAAAAAFSASLVLNKKVDLEFDIDRHDLYGRLLAYVYINDIFVNGSLLKAGYAKPLRFPPNTKYAIIFDLITASAFPPHCDLPLPAVSTDRLYTKSDLIAAYRKHPSSP